MIKKVGNLVFLSKKIKPKISEEPWKPLSALGKSDSSPKVAYHSLDYSDISGFSERESLDVSPQFP